MVFVTPLFVFTTNFREEKTTTFTGVVLSHSFILGFSHTILRTYNSRLPLDTYMILVTSEAPS